MKNSIVMLLFMFSASTFKQDKPIVSDTVKTHIVKSTVLIDTSAYVIPNKTLLDGTLEKVKELNNVVQKAKEKALEVERNAKIRNNQRVIDETIKGLDNLHIKTE